jgi:general stress protein 26
MPKPAPPELDPGVVPDLARACINDDKFPMLATMDGEQPRVRPVSPVRMDGFTIYIANLRSYGKTAEIAANPKAEICFMDGEHNQVRITGRIEEVTDRTLIMDIWNSYKLLAVYLGSPDNPEFMLYRFVPTQVRYMQEWALSYYEVDPETA